MSLFKMWAIQPYDGRHDEEKELNYSGNEWCEICQTEVSVGSTAYDQEDRKWKCDKCRKG